MGSCGHIITFYAHHITIMCHNSDEVAGVFLGHLPHDGNARRAPGTPIGGVIFEHHATCGQLINGSDGQFGYLSRASIGLTINLCNV